MPRRGHTRERFAVMAVAGVAAALVVGFSGHWLEAPVVGWLVACLVYVFWIFVHLHDADPEQTAAHATREDPGRGVTRVLLVGAAVASLVDVVWVLTQASRSTTASTQTLYALLAFGSVAASWLLIHTLFTLRYAEQYHQIGGGIDFNQPGPPCYRDFAYVAFGIGMTYQIADTTITHTSVRATALRHMLLSYLFGTVVLASVVNIIVGLLP
ncbi:MAG: DUF1345 domain-containing protein [Propionibacteriaceae bacterium]|nr:DUF1345 domain-containing protein [Propionibacteriaceae bacterium]